jgi:hypothetical protein
VPPQELLTSLHAVLLADVPVEEALLPVTVLQITLIHIDHAVPPRCINLLDIGCGLRR